MVHPITLFIEAMISTVASFEAARLHDKSQSSLHRGNDFYLIDTSESEAGIFMSQSSLHEVYRTGEMRNKKGIKIMPV